MATAGDIKELLEDTNLPPELVVELVDGAAPLWVASNTARTLAGDLVLFHPRLRPTEVRARAAALAARHGWRLTVLAHDRVGLLADTAAVLASSGLSVGSAGACTWPNLGLALHTLTVRGTILSETEWREFGSRLRVIGSGEAPSLTFVPAGEVSFELSSEDDHRWLLRVRAPDQIGLLWNICGGLADLGIGIQAAAVGGAGGRADDIFVIDGSPDVDALRRRLSKPRTQHRA